MQGKKRYLLVALLLLLLGFSVISFAGGNEESTYDTNGDMTINYDEAEEAVKLVEENPTEEIIEEVLEVVNELEDEVERETLVVRVENTKPAIEPAKLISHVENMIKEAENKTDIDEAQKYFENNNVQNSTSELTNQTVKENLDNRIQTIMSVFTDENNPVITGVDKNAYTNQNVTLKIEDELETTKTVTLNGEEIEYSETFDKEGTYVVRVTDSALNYDEITFTIDKTPAKRNYSTIRVKGNPYTKKDGYKIYYHLKKNESFEFAIAFDEILLNEPTVTIGGKELEVKLNPKETIVDGKRVYLYEGTFNLTDDIENGELEIKVSNVFDLAGNESTDESVLNQTPTSNNRRVVYDSKAPKSRYVAIISKAEDYNYIKNGETVRFLAAFDEEVNIPENKDERTFILNINGKEVKFIRSQGAGFEYIAEYQIPADESVLKEGELTFELSGYKDLTGNEGEKLTLATHSKYKKVIYDRTPVAITGIDKDTYVYNETGVTPTTKDTDVKTVVLTKNGEAVEYTIGETIVNVGNYKLVVTDLAGNETVVEFSIEAKQIEFELSVDKEIEFDNFEKTANIKVLNAKEEDYEIDVRYYILREDGTFYGPLKVDYAKELGEYKVKVVVKAKNSNYIDSVTKELRFKVLDTTNPILTVTRNEETNITYIRGIDLTRLVYTILKDGKVVHTVDSETCDCDNYFPITDIAKTYGDGEYTIEVVDAGGNKATATAMLDTSKPEITNYTQVRENNKTKVTVTFSEEIKPLSGWTKVDNENTYYKYYTESKEEVIEFVDVNGIKNSYTILVDATVPTVVASYTEKEIEEGSVTEFTDLPSFEVTDNSEGKVTETLISGEVNPNKVGTYKLTYRFTDEVGNYTDVVITVKVVDTNPPVIEGITDGMHYNTKTTHAIPNVTDKNLKKMYLISKVAGKEIILPCVNGVEIKLYGDYTLVAEDKYGNKTTKDFVVDNINPNVLLLDEIEYIQGNIIPIKPVIVEQYVDTIVVKKDGKVIEYKEGDQLTADANYEITVTDKAGNIGTATFTIDSTNPIVFNPIGVYKEFDLLVYDENYDQNNLLVLKKTRTIDIDTKLELPEEIKLPEGMKLEDYIKLPGNLEMPDKVEFPIYERYKLNGTKLTEEGEYILIVYDKAYNVTLTKVVIDHKDPTSNIEPNKSYKEVTPKVEDTNLVTVKLLENKIIPILDYEHGDTISVEGNYTLVAIDKAGNTLTVDFKVDRTAPVIDASNISTEVGAIENTSLDVTVIAKDKVDGEISVEPHVSHSTLGDLGKLSKIDTSKKSVGTYTLTYNVKDSAGNEAEEVVVYVEVKKTDYVISMANKTVAYNGLSRTPVAELRDDNGVVEGTIDFEIKNALGKEVTEMKDIGIYYVTATTKSYDNVKSVTATYKIEQAILKVEMTNLVKGDEIKYDKNLVETSNSIKERLVFKNQNDEVVHGVESLVVLYKNRYGNYSNLNDTKVEKGTYVYSVTALNLNYKIDNTATLKAFPVDLPLINSVLSNPYEIK